MQVTDWLATDGPLAAALPRFEHREEQVQMAEAVWQAFDEPHHLFVEAGTGVGKTFAYLLPAVAQASATRRRVVISTHTIALQEQIVEKDLPLILSTLGLDLKAELVKGRNNYVGLRRLKQTSERADSVLPNKRLLPVLDEIIDWAYVTTDGSLSDLHERPAIEVWEKVRSEHHNCLGRRCPQYEPCFYQRARRRAEQAQILIVNHALLMADLVLRRDNASVLPDYDFVIIDEAHTLDQVAADHLGTSVSNVQIQYLLSTLFNDRTGKGLLASLGTEQQQQTIVSAAAACTQFFNDLWAWQQSRGRSNGRLVLANPIDNPLSPALREVVGMLEALREKLPREEDQQEIAAATDRAERAAHATQALLEQNFAEYVYWIDIEQGRGRRISLNAAPLDAGVFLRELLFEPAASVILTSATLAVGSGKDPFSYIRQRVGDPDSQSLQLGSPFDFNKQVTIHIESAMPEPSNAELFQPASANAISYYLRQTEGRAFVLFTSYRHLIDAAERVRGDLEGDGFTILAQGEDLPRSKMLSIFRETDRCAIFGTDSFWQGVDVVGEALSNVIITKLPFAVPDRPTIEARIDLLRQQGKKPFFDYQIPEAILKLRQGFGRLIRSHSDTGIVVILDPRVLRKSYGKQFLNSLPKCPQVISKQPW
jgi:ATP-dependent DNA helicase DinG